MKIETSKSVLKVCGSIDMFYGVLEILLGVLSMAGGSLVSAMGSLAEADIPEVAGPLVLVTGIGIVLLGVFSLVEGILSRKAATDPSKARPVFVLAMISLQSMLSLRELLFRISRPHYTMKALRVHRILQDIPPRHLRKDRS